MNFINNLKNFIGSYSKEVQSNKQNPFFNSGHTFPMWLNELKQDTQKRGLIEGAHDLTYPVLQNPYIQPIQEPIISNIRMGVSRIPNQSPPVQIARKLLGLPPTINNIPWPK